MLGFGEAGGGTVPSEELLKCGVDGNSMRPLGVDLFEGFFTKFGSPGPRGRGEKPPELINRQLVSAESDVLDAVLQWARGGHQPGRTRLSAARPKGPPKRRGRKARMDGGLREQLCLLLSLGYSRRRAAEALEMDHSTISRSLKRDAELAESVRQAELRWLQRRSA